MHLCLFFNFCVILFFICIFFLSLFFFLPLYCIYHVYCYGRPALIDVCLHWQPATVLIVVQLFNLFIWLINKLSLSPARSFRPWGLVQRMLDGQQWIADVVAAPSFAVWPIWDAACLRNRDSVHQRSLRRSRSFKVTDIGTNRKLACDCLLVDWHPISYSF